MDSKIEIFKTTNGAEVAVQLEKDTVWLNRQQLTVLFNRDVKTIGKHINNIFNEEELDPISTVAKFAT
ncbi:MAG TPA: virulence factor, partial [Bacteroidales bacterium]|nr:virulence factor [Bacteroidales bacterium]